MHDIGFRTPKPDIISALELLPGTSLSVRAAPTDGGVSSRAEVTLSAYRVQGLDERWRSVAFLFSGGEADAFRRPYRITLDGIRDKEICSELQESFINTPSAVEGCADEPHVATSRRWTYCLGTEDGTQPVTVMCYEEDGHQELTYYVGSRADYSKY